MVGLLGVVYAVCSASFLYNAAEGRCMFLVRLFCFLLLEAGLGKTFSGIIMPPVRAMARQLPGAPPSAAEADDHQQHDATLVWPLPGTVLPEGWAAAAKGKQPYFLNHVSGAMRFRQAFVRVAAALGTLLQVGFMCALVDHRDLAAVGAVLVPTDVARGVAVGAGIICVLFCVEVRLGWLAIVGYGEVVVASERLPLNLLWDALFHLGVSLNEEVSLRGWLLVNMTHALVDHLGASPYLAMALAVALQASLFAALHLGSPGATAVGLANLVIGRRKGWNPRSALW